MSIEKKLDQLYAALAEMRIYDLSSIGLRYETVDLSPIGFESETTKTAIKISLDLSAATNPATVANRVSLLLHNIACLKDHLSSWCKKNGKQFNGNKFLKANRDAAIIHDLWNLDKHGASGRDSTSRFYPRLLEDAKIGLTLRGGGGRPSPRLEIGMALDHSSEKGRIQTKGDVSLSITATVVDKNGNRLGDLEGISLNALAAWEAEFVKAGVTLL